MIVPILLGTIPLKKDLMTDGGFRFRKNTLQASDNILGMGEIDFEFFDYEFYNLDTFSKSQYNYSNPKYLSPIYPSLKATL